MPPFLEELIDRVPGGRRNVLLGLVGLGAMIAIWGFARWATAPDWIALHPNLALATVGDVTATLDEAGIAYRLERGGTQLLVKDADLARARVLLAQRGLPAKGAPGFELFDQPAWGMTDFTQRINYRRALEGELERTIGQMRGVESARVHLALQEGSVFRREQRPSEASVFLRLRSGARPTSELVEGITFLVASSVDGLTSENVTVLDDAGRLLTAAVEPGLEAGGVTKRQLALQREVERYLETKAEELVAQVVGPENVRIRVSATLNYDRIDRTIQQVNPDEQVITQEQRSEVVPGPNTEGAGSTIENVTYEPSRQIERFTGGIGNIKRLTVAVLVNDAVFSGVGGAPRSEADLQTVEMLVRNAVGLDASRGDAISVASIPFERSPIAGFGNDGIDWGALAEGYARPLVGIIGAVLAFLLALRVIRTIRPPAEVTPVLADGPDLLDDGGDDESPRLLSDLRENGEELEGHAAVAALISQRPENAARVVRAWLKDG